MRVDDMPKRDPLEISVLYAEQERIKPGRTCGPVVRGVYIIECCTGGSGAVVINGKEFPFHAGVAYVLLPGDAVRHVTGPDCHREGVWCALEGASVSKYLEQAGITSESPYISPEVVESVRHWLQSLVSCWDSRDSGAVLRQTACAYGLLGALLQEQPAEKADSWLDKAVGYMQTNYAESLSVEKVAQQVGLERAWFSVQFKKKMGISPHQYLNGLRVKRACQLLHTGDYSVSEIAYLVGLEPHNFSRLIKRELGTTPQEFRKKNL